MLLNPTSLMEACDLRASSRQWQMEMFIPQDHTETLGAV